MMKILLSGCNGKMGQVVSRCVRERDDCTIVAGIDINTEMEAGYPVFSSPRDCAAPTDVLVDYSHPSVLEPLLEFAREKELPAVIATTGLSHEQIALVEAAAQSIPLFFTFNMSLGINLLCQLAQTAARVLGNEFDIEIIERHHNLKIDAPSGTALMLADAVSESLEQRPQYVYDRHSQRKRRSRGEIGLHSVRGGTIVGDHDVLFAGRDETITLSHSAMSKEVFATGAINAARFLCGKQPGLYDMKDLIGPA